MLELLAAQGHEAGSGEIKEEATADGSLQQALYQQGVLKGNREGEAE